jgi:peptide chain release factor 1
MTSIDQLQQQLDQVTRQIEEVSGMLNDPDLADLAKDDITLLNYQKTALESSITALSGDFQKPAESTQQHSFDYAQAILEIRGGAGGEEAKLFAEDLMRMYARFAETKKLKLESLDDGVVKIKGRNAYGIFKYESGIHRVQRVPSTEASGRIHTSTASVAVLPEIPKAAVDIRDEDLEWKFSRAGGHGGQNVNKVATAVTLTHTPSGLVVHCRQERYQQQNKEIALELLRGRLWEIEEDKRTSQIETTRKSAVGRAMRSEKIRTYNYPENRVTDHRIPKTWKNLDRIMEGQLNDIIEAIQAKDTQSTIQ